MADLTDEQQAILDTIPDDDARAARKAEMEKENEEDE